MKWRVLISAPYAFPVINWYRLQLQPAGCEIIVAPVKECLTEQELLPLVGDVDGIICGDDQISDRVLAAAARLKVISKWGTGIDSIDQASAIRRGIRVRNTPNAFSEPVADTVLGYMLLFVRQLDVMNRDIRNGLWEKLQLASLREKTLGVIGVGNCGKAVVRRAIAFGMRVLGNDLVEMPAEFLAATGIQMLSFDELLREADFVSVNTTLNPTSYHLINESALSLMKPEAYLINTSRGPVVDEPSLASALVRRRIAGAALDVFEIEPLPTNSLLRQLDNCWLAPHNANSSPLAAEYVHKNTIRNLLEELQARESNEAQHA
jgi:D-3-phosphoglycerate dehydrogenase